MGVPSVVAEAVESRPDDGPGTTDPPTKGGRPTA